ncbi:hypothetical protein U1Q18_013802 [Sarracenia purpurea var. burkii]
MHQVTKSTLREPATVSKRAKGLASLTVTKAGMLPAYKLGSDSVVAGGSYESRSVPSVIISGGVLNLGLSLWVALRDFEAGRPGKPK